MGQFGQFGLNRFKRGQTNFSQLHISLDPDELAMQCAGLLKLHVWAVSARSVPK